MIRKLMMLLILLSNILYASYCEQYVTVNYKPEKGVKIYGIEGGTTDKRGIVDLGHFSGLETNKIFNLGRIEVTVEMKDNGNGSEKNDIEIVELDKLINTVWNYKYDITPFIKQGDNVIAEIRVENTNIKEGTTEEKTMIFICDGENHEHPRLVYEFDLILELRNLDIGGMYGISSIKDEGTKAYINLRDLIGDQLKGRNLKP